MAQNNTEKHQLFALKMKWVNILVNSLEDMRTKASLLDTTKTQMSYDDISNLSDSYQNFLNTAKETKEKHFHKLCQEIWDEEYDYDVWEYSGFFQRPNSPHPLPN